jgi:hypothetical protein
MKQYKYVNDATYIENYYENDRFINYVLSFFRLVFINNV